MESDKKDLLEWINTYGQACHTGNDRLVQYAMTELAKVIDRIFHMININDGPSTKNSDSN